MDDVPGLLPGSRRGWDRCVHDRARIGSTLQKSACRTKSAVRRSTNLRSGPATAAMQRWRALTAASQTKRASLTRQAGALASGSLAAQASYLLLLMVLARLAPKAQLRRLPAAPAHLRDPLAAADRRYSGSAALLHAPIGGRGQTTRLGGRGIRAPWRRWALRLPRHRRLARPAGRRAREPCARGRPARLRASAVLRISVWGGVHGARSRRARQPGGGDRGAQRRGRPYLRRRRDTRAGRCDAHGRRIGRCDCVQRADCDDRRPTDHRYRNPPCGHGTRHTQTARVRVAARVDRAGREARVAVRSRRRQPPLLAGGLRCICGRRGRSCPSPPSSSSR